MSDTLFSIPDEFISRFSETKKDLPTYRNEFMRDRDRIMYCTAFKRLAGKTQIYTIGSDDHKKNRLTHSLEVAQIARTIAKGLHLNEELTEAIALGHDLGHTPFGHAGEKMLHCIMCPKSDVVKDSPFYGKEEKEIRRELEREGTTIPEIIRFESMFGFKHNIQSVRVAAVLEDSYRGGEGENIGLNLTNYTLWGMMHHSKMEYGDGSYQPTFQKQLSEHMRIKGGDSEAWSFEAFVVEHADDIAQWHHDLEDAVRGNALPINSICELIKEAFGAGLSDEDIKNIDSIEDTPALDRKCLAELSHIVINTLTTNLVNSSAKRLTEIAEQLKRDYPEADEDKLRKTLFSDMKFLGNERIKGAIAFSDSIKTAVFKDNIKSSVHHSKDVERMNAKGKYIIKKLFEAYNSHPQQLPDGIILHYMVDIGRYKTIESAKAVGMGRIRTEFEAEMENPKTIFRCQLMRRICDHIACMTDRYAIEEYNNLYG